MPITPPKLPKKLIEVALPLEAINVASAREKSIRHGHPSTLHLWWARRPLAAARAVMKAGEFAQAWNTRINPGMPAQMSAGSKGVSLNGTVMLVERIVMTMTDPSPDLPKEERSTTKHMHAILSDIRGRKAM